MESTDGSQVVLVVEEPVVEEPIELHTK